MKIITLPIRVIGAVFKFAAWIIRHGGTIKITRLN